MRDTPIDRRIVRPVFILDGRSIANVTFVKLSTWWQFHCAKDNIMDPPNRQLPVDMMHNWCASEPVS